MNEKTFQSLLQNYFLKRLLQQRKVSPQTINSYRDTFRIYLGFLKNRYSIDIPSVSLGNFDRTYISEFCTYLEESRSNKASTINNRLAAIRSFLKFVGEQNPEYSGSIRSSLMVHSKRKRSYLWILSRRMSLIFW